jgi:hypothetical protein
MNSTRIEQQAGGRRADFVRLHAFASPMRAQPRAALMGPEGRGGVSGPMRKHRSPAVAARRNTGR